MEEDQTISQQSGWSRGLTDRLTHTIQRVKDLDLLEKGFLYDRYDVGFEIAILRWTAHMTQTEFGRKVGFNKIWVCAVENNRVSPRIVDLQQIARAFGLRVKVSFELPADHDQWSVQEEFQELVRSAQ